MYFASHAYHIKKFHTALITVYNSVSNAVYPELKHYIIYIFLEKVKIE